MELCTILNILFVISRIGKVSKTASMDNAYVYSL